AAARRSLHARGDGGLLGRLVEKMPAARTLFGCGPALADHAQGAHLLADRRHRRGADDLVAGMPGPGAKLGLSLLLAARRAAHADGADGCRFSGRGAVLARLAVTRHRRQSGAGPDHVWDRRRAAADGSGTAVVAGAPGLRAGPHRQWRSQPAPARYLWRGAGCVPSGEM